MKQPRILIAGVCSGSGKTTISCGIMKSLIDMRLKVAAFKCGPDYIDPMFHSDVVGADSCNLDSFFVDDDVLKYLFCKSSEEHDISIIEGVMGFYDGWSSSSSEGSSCSISLKTSTPVILIIDGKGSALSSLAMLNGFLNFQKNMIKGVIFNNMSKPVFEALKDDIENMGVVALGYIPKMKDIHLGSRHLGLIMPSEIQDMKSMLSTLSTRMHETIDFQKLLKIAESASDIEYKEFEITSCDHVRVGVAKDQAFCFLYKDNISLLERLGAEICYFSPLIDKSIPDVDCLILPGGYPELYADELEKNESMRFSIKDAISKGMPCMAECGGFMYLHDSIVVNDITKKMCGVVPGECRDTGKLAGFGYVSLTPKENNQIIKGHEFHYWESTNPGKDWNATKTSGKKYQCMHDNGTSLYGFPHLFYYSNIEVVKSFLLKGITYSKKKKGE